MLRVVAVIAAVVFAIGTPLIQSVVPFGLTPAEFANDGNETLRAGRYAFSIWGLIYFGLAAYAVYQAMPRTQETPLLKLAGWPSVIGIAGCGFWILASAFDQKIATVVIIAGSALIITLTVWAGALLDMGRGERWFVLIPLALLAGWLTVATALNTLTVLTALEIITPASATPAAVLGIIIVALIALFVVARVRLAAYGLPIAWGLAAIYASDAPFIGLGATAAALAVGGFSLWTETRRNSRRAQP
jgi:hypothetical protein